MLLSRQAGCATLQGHVWLRRGWHRSHARLWFVQTTTAGAGGRPQPGFPLLSPQGSLGCQSVSEMMGFYMEEVLPSAMKTSTHHQQSMGDLGNLLLSLRTMMRRCVSGARQHGDGQGGQRVPRSRAGAGAWDGVEEQGSRQAGPLRMGFVLTIISVMKVQEHHVQPALHIRARLKRRREGRRRSVPYLDAGAPKITPGVAMSPSVETDGTNPVPDRELLSPGTDSRDTGLQTG